MSWQVLTCTSVFLFSVAMVVQRRLMHHHKCEPHAFVVLSQGLVGVFALGFALAQGFSWPDFSGLWLVALGSVAFHGAGYIVHAKALQIMEASVFSVFYATQAIWIMLLGVLLFHERPSPVQLLGVACIFGSIALLMARSRQQWLSRSALLGMLTGLLFGIAVTCWVYVGRQTDTVSWAALGFLGVALVAFVARPSAMRNVRPFFSRSVGPHMVAVAALLSAGGIALLLAYAAGDISSVSPLRQMSIVITVLLAVLFLPEERTELWRKAAAMALCFVGALLIV